MAPFDLQTSNQYFDTPTKPQFGQNLLAGLTILLAGLHLVGLIIGVLLILFYKPMSRWLRYNLFQAVFLSIGVAILYFIITAVESALRFPHLVSLVFVVVMILLFLFMALKFFSNKEFDVPFIGEQVRKHFMH